LFLKKIFIIRLKLIFCQLKCLGDYKVNKYFYEKRRTGMKKTDIKFSLGGFNGV